MKGKDLRVTLNCSHGLLESKQHQFMVYAKKKNGFCLCLDQLENYCFRWFLGSTWFFMMHRNPVLENVYLLKPTGHHSSVLAYSKICKMMEWGHFKSNVNSRCNTSWLELNRDDSFIAQSALLPCTHSASNHISPNSDSLVHNLFYNIWHTA